MARAKGTGSKKPSKASSTASEATASDIESREVSQSQDTQQTIITTEERYRLIAEAAYFRAEARGFQGGDPMSDWLDAEAEVNRMLLPIEQQQDRQDTFEPSRRAAEEQQSIPAQKPSAQGSNRPRPS